MEPRLFSDVGHLDYKNSFRLVVPGFFAGNVRFRPEGFQLSLKKLGPVVNFLVGPLAEVTAGVQIAMKTH